MHYFLQLFFFVFVLTQSSLAKSSNEKISLQLKWISSFQFAGYYMALEKGYYTDEGLDVTIIERDPKRNNIEQVVSGEADYGIADSSLLLYRSKGNPVKIIASIFQHSPLIFIAHQDSKIVSPYEMKGKKISFEKGLDDSALLAMLDSANIKSSDYTYFPHDITAKIFIDHKVDAISAYITNQPYLMKELNIPINIIDPLNYGIDFYGDNLFTTEKELNKHPDRAKRFLKASLKGWKYALANKDETISLLRNKYNAQSSNELLKYEASMTEKMIMPTIVELGYTSKERFYRIAELYRSLGMCKQNNRSNAVDDLIWNPNQEKHLDMIYAYWLGIGMTISILIGITFFMINQRLKQLVKKRTQIIEEQHLMLDKYVIMSTTDSLGIITTVSDAFCEISGYNRDEIVGKKHSMLRHPENKSSVYKKLSEQLHTNKTWVGEIRNISKNGTLYWLQTTIIALVDSDNIVIGYQGIQQNVTDKKYVETISLTDQLTQINNRRYLDLELTKELKRTMRYRYSLCVMMIDIDHFKQVNDKYGHLVGDKVLIEVSSILNAAIRNTDILGRWGGEEFLIICALNKLEEALHLAEKLRLSVEQYEFTEVINLTISIGVTCAKEIDNESSLMERTDRALYDAKIAGRNRVSCLQ